MKYSFFGFGIIIFGIIGLFILVLFENITINNESEYYTLKEAVKASMYESIDKSYYRDCAENSDGNDCIYGGIKISEEKFVANCTRRFYKSISGTGNGYQLIFYDIMESPPKVSVRVVGKTNDYAIFVSSDNSDQEADFNIVNELSAILEYNYK